MIIFIRSEIVVADRLAIDFDFGVTQAIVVGVGAADEGICGFSSWRMLLSSMIEVDYSDLLVQVP